MEAKASVQSRLIPKIFYADDVKELTNFIEHAFRW
jgi:hypothetical protein